MDIGPTELIIILVIVIVLFGVGRISKIAGELGSGIRAFREGLQAPEDENKTSKTGETRTVEPGTAKEPEKEATKLEDS